MNYPRYISHKTVGAARISAVDHGADGSVIVHLEGGFDNVVISHYDKKNKPNPEVGNYLVQYEDGHISFSPAKAFEEGYAPLGEGWAAVDEGAGVQTADKTVVDTSELLTLSNTVIKHAPDLEVSPDAVVMSASTLIDRLASRFEAATGDEDEDDEEEHDSANNHGQDAPAEAANVTG
jgi:hypothetical protein